MTTGVGETAEHRRRVLLADDNIVNQMVAMRVLQEWAYEVDAVDDGQAAVVAYQRVPYDLVLMDVEMPEMDGYEATAALRRIEQQTGRHTPIIAMTGHDTKEGRDDCLRAGMDDHVTKPLKLDQLLAVLTRWMTSSPNP